MILNFCLTDLGGLEIFYLCQYELCMITCIYYISPGSHTSVSLQYLANIKLLDYNCGTLHVDHVAFVYRGHNIYLDKLDKTTSNLRFGCLFFSTFAG